MLRGGSSAPETPRRGTGAAETCDSPEAPRRLNRAVKPSAKVREAMVPLERGAEMRGGPSITVRSEGGATRALEQSAQTTGNTLNEVMDGRTIAGKKMIAMMEELKVCLTLQAEVMAKQSKTISDLHTDVRELKENTARDQQAMKEELQATKNELQAMGKRMQALEKAVDDLTVGTQALPSGNPSYAGVARTPPSSQPSNVRSLSTGNTTTSTRTDTPRCTIDISKVMKEDQSKANVASIRQAIESEVRSKEGQSSWRCVAISRDARNIDRIRITCRDEAETLQVKEAVTKMDLPGVRVLQDQLYPVKVDNANRTGIIDTDGVVRPETIEALAKENEVSIAKIRWLSRLDNNKAYGSMVVFLSKGSDAVKLLREQYFTIAGESARTNIFESRPSPTQCYNCQEMGHKAAMCSNPQVCAKCAEPGHRHEGCHGREPKCVPCGGPHESFSKICRARQLRLDV